MANKHTPGPWAVAKFDGVIAIKEASMFKAGNWHFTDRICTMDSYEKQKEANAHLMASAPELLEALQECIQVYEATRDAQPTGYLWSDPNHIFHARNAIKKALGKEAHNG